MTLEDTAVVPIRREREIAEADAYRVGQRVGQRRRDGVDGAFLHALRAERADGVVRIRE